MLFDVPCDWNYKRKIAVIMEFRWYCLPAFFRESRHCRESILIFFFYDDKECHDLTRPLQTVGLCCKRNLGADRFHTFLLPWTQVNDACEQSIRSCIPMNNNKNRDYILVKIFKGVEGIFNVKLCLNIKIVTYHPFCSSVPILSGAWLKYPQLQ